MYNKSLYQCIGCMALALLVIEPALAGPGGKIASAAFETFWGRIALGALTLFFLPLITYVMAQEWLASRRAQKDLAFVAIHDQRFAWLKLKLRARECFQRVHSGWQDGDLSDVSQWMTSWYWQNQQSVHLNRWKSEGLVNVCKVKKVGSMRPLLFVHRNEGDIEHEDSQVVISITAKMQDYLKSASTGKVVEGSKKWKEVETLWTLSIVDGRWLVSDIEEGSDSLVYAKMRKHLPVIESTMAGHLDA